MDIVSLTKAHAHGSRLSKPADLRKKSNKFCTNDDIINFLVHHPAIVLHEIPSIGY